MKSATLYETQLQVLFCNRDLQVSCDPYKNPKFIFHLAGENEMEFQTKSWLVELMIKLLC